MKRDMLLEYAFFVIPLLIIWVVYLKSMAKRNQRNIEHLQKVTEQGLTEPPSLHPLIDPALCLGSGACVTACPEGDVLGLISGKAQLINPTHCIGHGACLPACPHEAITLVFGTEKRGVDIPHVQENFETNVSGIFIAGELGGMGLIANATEQGRQAIGGIIQSLKEVSKKNTALDVLIVGAGPAGFSASLAALEHKLSYKTIEQETLGGRVAHYPRGKIVMTRPTILPIMGKIKLHETTKEALLSLWQDIERKTGVKISTEERMESVTPSDNGFFVKTSRTEYETRTVLLCLGRGGTPRKLGVPGEALSKVVYRLTDPGQYRGQKVLVVGGGDTALEAAIVLSQEEGTEVILSYRSPVFSRAKEKNRQKIKIAESKHGLKIYLESHVKEIYPDRVAITYQGKVCDYENDIVLICVGGVLPIAFLKGLGVAVDRHHGEI